MRRGRTTGVERRVRRSFIDARLSRPRLNRSLIACPMPCIGERTRLWPGRSRPGRRSRYRLRVAHYVRGARTAHIEFARPHTVSCRALRIVPRTVSMRRRMGVPVAYTDSSSRGFSRRAFYGLMTLTKQGCFGADTRRGEAERDPSHPIRVIPAREVSKSFVSRRAAFHPEGGCRRVLLPLHPQPPPRVSSLGTCVSLPYGKDPMTAQSSVLYLFCTHGARRGTHGVAALRKGQSA